MPTTQQSRTAKRRATRKLLKDVAEAEIGTAPKAARTKTNARLARKSPKAIQRAKAENLVEYGQALMLASMNQPAVNSQWTVV